MRGKTLPITLAVLLALSLICNGVLAVIAQQNTNSAIVSQANVKQLMGRVADLTSRNESLNSQASGLSSDLANERQASAGKDKTIGSLETQIASLETQVGTLQSDNSNMRARVNQVMCPYTLALPNSVSTNQSLVDPITRAVEEGYGKSSVSTSFTVLWNNSKTANFDVILPGNISIKVIASWNLDTGVLQGVYDVGGSCFLYLP